jgi:glycosidase
MVLRLEHSKRIGVAVSILVAGVAFGLHGCEVGDPVVNGPTPPPSPNDGSGAPAPTPPNPSPPPSPVQKSSKWWLRAAAMQTISPSCYSMTLSDLYNYLDTLKENGVYTLTLNAVYDHGSGYNEKEPSGEHSLWCGLAISDPLNVNSVFGSEAEFDKFVKTAHDKGMKVMSWFNPSYWWTGSPHIKKAEQDLKRHGNPDNVKSSDPDSPALWFDWKSDNPGKSKPPDNAPGSKGRSVAGDSRPGGWVWDDDAGFAYWSKWAFQPTTNFGSDAWQRKYEEIAKYWIQERKVDGFTYDDPHGYYKVDGFKEKNADLMRTLSADSFFQNAEIYGDPHAGLEFGMDSVLPASWGEDKEIFIWIADKIKRDDMNGLDDLLGKYYDKFAQANRDAGELVTFPWMRQMVDPFWEEQ